ncbi:methyl-accepting chemotaxis protein [Paraburkholderia tropica]|uniref:methyl-accepting chemotaxis protein n=1 Tax=Paraburkholderia tropica TaxID=92647 RepID=UPI002AB2FCCC|nr:methyl-accepting chemotaxis protein [Paraburkholderia tropica]
MSETHAARNGRSIDQSDFLISRTDLKGNIVYASEAFAHALGYQVKEIIGRPYAELVPTCCPKAMFADIRATIDAGKRWEGVAVNVCRDGSYLWTLTSIAPSWREGRVSGFVSLRTQATPERIAQTSRAFDLLNGPAGRRYGLKEGALVRNNAFARILRSRLPHHPMWLAPAGSLVAFAIVLAISLGANTVPGRHLSSLAAGLIPAVSGFGFLLSAWFIRIVMRDVLTPVGQANDFLYRIAAGDLSGRFHASSDGRAPAKAEERESSRSPTLGTLARALNLTRASLSLIVHNIGTGARELAGATGQLASGNADLSQRTERAAAALQATAAETRDLAETVRQNAARASEAARITTDTTSLVQEGNARVTDAIEAIRAIAQSSRRIAEITGMIDSIAAQTNILALNAAVEAARAGQQGRGFAVVAAEVRVLSQRTATAAQEIAGLVNSSVQQVNEGRTRVEEAASVAGSVTRTVQRVDGLMHEISSASEAQSLGLQRLSETIEFMDVDLQQNAALVEQASAAGHSLNEQSAMFASMVEIFQLDAMQ